MHAKLNRTLLRWALLALALGGLQIAHAAKTTVGTGAATNWVATRSGSNVTVSLQAGGGAANVATAKALNSGSAWQQLANNPNAYASRVGVGLSSAGDPTFEALLRQPMGGAARAAELRAVSQIEKVSLGKALGLFAARANPLISSGIALYQLANDLGFTIKTGQNGDQNQITRVIPGGYWKFTATYCGGSYGVEHTIYAASVSSLASQVAAQANATMAMGLDGTLQGGCGGNSYSPGAADESSGAFVLNWSGRDSGQAGLNATKIAQNTEQIATTDEFASAVAGHGPYSPTSGIEDAVVDAINSGRTMDAEDPTLSGPNVVIGPEETTTNSDGSVSKSTTSFNCTYSLGPTEVCLPTGTTTTTTKPDGSTTTTTSTPTNPGGTTTTSTGTTTTTTTSTSTTTTATTTTVPGTGTTSDLCKDHPDVLACSKPELDTPSGTIPKADRALTYTAENLGLGGTCPTDKTITLHGGKVIKAWDWAASCSYITTYIKPFVILIAGFISLMIILPARTET